MSDNINFYERIQSDVKYNNPVKDGIQHPANILCCGQTGSGKTNAILNIILHNKNFERFIICTKQPDEPLYQYIAKVISEIDPSRIMIFDDIKKMPDIDTLEQPELQTMAIFDDMVTEGKKVQEEIQKIFIRCRKRNITACYLSQDYYTTPKTIRRNVHYIILKSIPSTKEVRAIIKDFGLNVNINDLLKMYEEATAKMTDFFMIDLKSSGKGDKDMVFRKNFKGIKGVKGDEIAKKGKPVKKPKYKDDIDYLRSILN